MLRFQQLGSGTNNRSHYRTKEKRDTVSIWAKHSDTQMDKLLLPQTSHFDPAHEWSVDTLRAETLASPPCCSSNLSHYVLAATHFPANALALRDGRGFTVMRLAHLDTMERDACCLAAALMERTAILSQVPVYAPLASRWVHALIVRKSVLLLSRRFIRYVDFLLPLMVTWYLNLLWERGRSCQDASTSTEVTLRQESSQ